MAEQSYERHGHHPVFTYVASVFTLLALILVIGAALFGWRTFQAAVLSLTLAVATLVSISRRYIVRLQDRIILLEMKVRAAELLTPEQEARLAALGKRQVIALRFASDAELPELVDRAARESLTSDQIKRAIKNWRSDYHRT
jgi:uncharacterized protein DUF6526